MTLATAARLLRSAGVTADDLRALYPQVRLDDPPVPPKQPVPEPEPAATAESYTALLRRHRRRQLETTRENLERMQGTYDRAIDSIVRQVAELPPGMLDEEGAIRREHLEDLLRELQAIRADMSRDFDAEMQAGMLATAQTAADREAATAALVGAPEDRGLAASQERTFDLSDEASVSVSFGRTARFAVERLASRYYSDGLRLSDRLYSLDQDGRRAIEDTIIQGVAEGTPCRQLARSLEETLAAAGAANPRDRAHVIAVTEMAHAYREADILAATDPDTGELKSYIACKGYRLSGSHAVPDVCDLRAAHDSGLGRGNYLPAAFPLDHPRGLCYSISVLKMMPEVDGVTLEPDPGAVPESQVAYYAGKGDPAAIAERDRRVKPPIEAPPIQRLPRTEAEALQRIAEAARASGASDDDAERIRRVWEERWAGKDLFEVSAERRGVVEAALHENGDNPLFTSFESKFGQQPVIFRKPDQARGEQDEVGEYVVRTTHVYDSAFMPAERHGSKPLPGMFSLAESEGVPGLLRHEYGHHLYATIDKALRNSLLDAMHEHSGTWASALSEYGGTNAKEAFSELFALATSQNYNAGDWDAWVQNGVKTIRGWVE